MELTIGVPEGPGNKYDSANRDFILHIPMYRIVSNCGPGGQNLFVRGSYNLRYQNVEFKFIFWRKIGTKGNSK